MKRLHLYMLILVALAFGSTSALAGGIATFPDGTVLAQSGAAFLCMPGQPGSAQDQTSGLFEVGGEMFSVGDDSGQIFRFGLDAPYMDYCDAMRVPRWRPNLDLEALTYIPEIDEFVVSFERWDTKVQFVRIEDDALVLDQEFFLELPPGYKRGTNLGPEGLAYDPVSGVLMVGWEGMPFFRGLERYLTLYRVNCGEGEVTSVKFLCHVRLPRYIESCCGLYYDTELRALLVLDRNADTLYVFPGFEPMEAALMKNPQNHWEDSLAVRFSSIVDGFGREYGYRSFEGVAIGKDGTLGLVTDPWRSRDYSKYRTVDMAQMDDYYRKFVPQIVWFDDFRGELAYQISLHYE
ncbi:SdiA-regulated domain-containing protein [bacterium]|nr:SdiA-regulated domain-containing protein [bacterium]